MHPVQETSLLIPAASHPPFLQFRGVTPPPRGCTVEIVYTPLGVVHASRAGSNHRADLRTYLTH